MEYTTQCHIADGMLQVSVPEAWDHMDVTVTIEPVATMEEIHPVSDKQQKLKALEAYFATVASFPQSPVLSDEDISRETLYGQRG